MQDIWHSAFCRKDWWDKTQFSRKCRDEVVFKLKLAIVRLPISDPQNKAADVCRKEKKAIPSPAGQHFAVFNIRQPILDAHAVQYLPFKKENLWRFCFQREGLLQVPIS